MDSNVKFMVIFGKMAREFTDKLGSDLEALGMPFSVYPILAHLNQVEKAKTQKLGEVAVITSGTITHTVNKLVKEGFVEKVQDKEDRRIYWVQITKEGRAAFQKVHDEHMKYLDYLLEDFSEDEKMAMIETMKALGKSIANKSRSN